MIRYKARHNRPKGTIETFTEDASVVANEVGVPVTTMVASVTAGSAIGINSQSYSSSTESLAFQVIFSERGSGVISITTTFDGTDEKVISLYKFTVLDDGSSYGLTDYV